MTVLINRQLFNESPARAGANAEGFGGCELTGIGLSDGRRLANLGSLAWQFSVQVTAVTDGRTGSILLDGVAIVITLGLLFLANRKRAAVGRRYTIYSCEHTYACGTNTDAQGNAVLPLRLHDHITL